MSVDGVGQSGQGTIPSVIGQTPTRVHVLDTALDSVLGSPDVGGQPAGVGPRPDGTGAYVACGEERQAWLVDDDGDAASKIYTEGTSSFVAVDAAVSPDGTKVALVDGNASRVRILSTADHVAVAPTITTHDLPRSVAWSEDGAKLVVAGERAIDIFDASSGAELNTKDVLFYSAWDVAVRGSFAFVTQEKEGDGGQGPAGIQVVNLANNTFSLFIPLLGNTPRSILVSPDGTRAWVAMADQDLVREVSLVNQQATNRTVATGSGPVAMGFVAASGGGGGTPIPSWFLPKKLKLSIKGEGRDSLLSSGFFDDGGATVDWGDPVTLNVGGFEETFTLTANTAGTSFKFTGNRVAMTVKPNLRGSSRGLFRLKISKTTLSGLLDPEGEVPLSFEADGLEECTGRVKLARGIYGLGKVRGALLEPAFFPAKAKAKAPAGRSHSLTFTGGFATQGPLPATAGPVTLSFGPTFTRTIPGGSFSGSNGVFTHTAREGATSISVKVDHSREKVTVRTKGLDLGNLSAPTLDVVFDAGGGLGSFRNTVRLGTKGTTRTY